MIICSVIPIFSLNEITPKFCINCKFFINSFLDNNRDGRCSVFPNNELPKEKDIDYYVTGIKKNNHLNFCFTARACDNMCGKEGKKYISKLDDNDHFC